MFLLHTESINSSGHWTWLDGSANSSGIYPSQTGESGGWPGSRLYHSQASVGDVLYLFGGVGYGNNTNGIFIIAELNA